MNLSSVLNSHWSSDMDIVLGQVKAVAVQLMEVVYRVQDNSWLVKLLRGMIFGPGSGDKQKKVTRLL